MIFRTQEGIVVPAVTAEQMREVDRVAVEEFGLGILQMMENAGRNLAQNQGVGEQVCGLVELSIMVHQHAELVLRARDGGMVGAP